MEKKGNKRKKSPLPPQKKMEGKKEIVIPNDTDRNPHTLCANISAFLFLKATLTTESFSLMKGQKCQL